MKSYEITYLISPDLSEEEAKTLQDKIISFLQAEEGILAEMNKAERKILSFPIKKKSSAFLSTGNFQLSPEKLEGFEKKLKEEVNILRYLILSKKSPKKIETSLKRPRKRMTKPKVELKEIEEKLEEILGK